MATIRFNLDASHNGGRHIDVEIVSNGIPTGKKKRLFTRNLLDRYDNEKEKLITEVLELFAAIAIRGGGTPAQIRNRFEALEIEI